MNSTGRKFEDLDLEESGERVRSHPWHAVMQGAAPRVLMVTPQPFFEERGTPIAVALTARALVESGYQVDLLAFPVGRSIPLPGVRIERCGNPLGFDHVPIGFSIRKVILDASLYQSFDELLTRRRYDIVHAVEEAAWLASVLCPVKEIPFIYDMASSIPEQLESHWLLGRQPLQGILRGAEDRVISRAAHVVCSAGLGARVGRSAPDAAVTNWRFPVLESDADPMVVDALRRKYEISPFDRVVLYTGNFSRYQGMDLLLDAFAAAAEGDGRLMLVCVGASDAREAALFEARLPVDLRSRVRILPRERREMMPAWLSLADCLVSLRTAGDNVPLKLFEYMAARRPIVASVGPAHMPVLNDQRAFLCQLSVSDVASAISRVFADPERARVVANAAGDHAARHFSWPQFRQLVAGIYDSVLQPLDLLDRQPVLRQR